MSDCKTVKQYPVTEEIADLFDEALACENCRDQAVQSIFSSSRAIKYGKRMIQARREAWDLTNDLYPELEGKRLVYWDHDQTVTVKEEK